MEKNYLKHWVNPSLSFQGALNISSLFEKELYFLKNFGFGLFWEGVDSASSGEGSYLYEKNNYSPFGAF